MKIRRSPFPLPAPIPQKIPFTREAFQKLQEDFDRLTQERKEVMVRLQTAREMGDLSENGAYIYAKFELGSITRQLSRLRHLLENGVVTEKIIGNDTVDFGCTVTLRKDGTDVSYTIVSIHESNLAEKKLSTESPIGAAIMGQKVGSVVKVKTPAKEVEYLIVKIE